MAVRKPAPPVVAPPDEVDAQEEEVTPVVTELPAGHVRTLPVPEAVPQPPPPDDSVALVARVAGQISKGDQVATPGSGVDLIDLGDGELYDVGEDGKVVGPHKSK